MTPQQIAHEINSQFKRGDEFAGLFYGWVGSPWRPGDTYVAFKRCWAEGDVLCIETTQPYEDLSSSLQLRIHAPAGRIETGPRVYIEQAARIEVDGTTRLPLPGGGVAFANFWAHPY